MRKAWPWRCLTILWLAGVGLYVRALLGVRGHRAGLLVACLLAAELLFVGFQLVLQTKWEEHWDQLLSSHRVAWAAPSERARSYYTLGLFCLYLMMVGFGVATYWFLFDPEALSSMICTTMIAHGFIVTARKLALVPDEIQHDARKMSALGLPRQATEKEMTGTAIRVMGWAVILTLALCVNLIYGIPVWLSLLASIVLALCAVIFWIGVGLPPFRDRDAGVKPPFLSTVDQKSEKIETS
jgi:hypothetical protein